MRTFFHSYVLICEMFLKYLKFILILIIGIFSLKIQAEDAQTKINQNQVIPVFCEEQLSKFKSFFKQSKLSEVCLKAAELEGCRSVKGASIFHIDEKSKNMKSKNILVFSLIHGDETDAGVLGRYWIERLNKLDPRNNWRIIPILNPDGTQNKTRANSNGVDLNRNFPTRDWKDKALSYWKDEAASSPRKFPGHQPASEPEVNCALKHIHEFNPDFVMSIHTPLKVLDFDGPKLTPPIYDYLPWKRLGNFPGSLGRYLWIEKNIPVLTTELGSKLPKESSIFEKLQDVIGQLVQLDLK